MKRIIYILIFAVFCGCGSKDAVVKREKLQGKKKNIPAAVKNKQTAATIVALLPFKSSVDNRDSREKAKKLFKSVNSLLETNKKFKVIERHKLEEILYEISSGYEGIADVSTAVQVGKLLGVSIIVCGRLGAKGENFLSIQIINVKTGKTMGGAIKWDGNDTTFSKFIEKISREISSVVENIQ